MSTYSVSTTPLTIVRRRPGTLPMRWQSPSGQPIDVTGFTVTAQMKWRDGVAPLTVERPDDPNGRFLVRWTADQIAALPRDLVSELHVLIAEPTGDTHDAVYPVRGVDQ